MSDKKDLTSIVELPPMDFEPMESMLPADEPHHPEALSLEPALEQVLETPMEPESLTATPVTAAPAGSSHTHEMGDAPQQLQSFDEVKHYAEQIPIGTPHVEANPPFSVLISMQDEQPFSTKAIQALENALGSDDFGIHFDEIKVQLTGSKVLIPRISEFAAVTLAQKMRDTVDTVAMGLAEEIYQSETLASDGENPIMLSQSEVFQQHREEVRDLAAEPKAMNELFSTNLGELSGYKITRILSALTASELLESAVAENTASREFERASNRVTRELLERAFRLGAHGIVGLTFSLKPTAEIAATATTASTHRYRLLGTCTAVRAKKISA